MCVPALESDTNPNSARVTRGDTRLLQSQNRLMNFTSRGDELLLNSNRQLAFSEVNGIAARCGVEGWLRRVAARFGERAVCTGMHPCRCGRSPLRSLRVGAIFLSLFLSPGLSPAISSTIGKRPKQPIVERGNMYRFDNRCSVHPPESNACHPVDPREISISRCRRAVTARPCIVSKNNRGHDEILIETCDSANSFCDNFLKDNSDRRTSERALFRYVVGGMTLRQKCSKEI